ncbi:hypothetical protein [Streptomyces sp. NPDC050507]|uniref:hypothetical protein n=1 Tax=Streptomyces sp. NPDC050507 TaxID=3365619 RepID=UPI0037AB4CD5
MDSDSTTTAEAVVPAQQPSGLPPGFHEVIDGLKSIARSAHAHDGLKSIARSAHARAQLKVNTEMLQMYGEIGRTIPERQRGGQRGTKIIDRIATAQKSSRIRTVSTSPSWRGVPPSAARRTPSSPA